MKILVTGATGFIGENLIKNLLFKNYEVHCIIRIDSNISKINNRSKVFRYDENIDSLIKYFEYEKFDGVIHLASLFLAIHDKYDISNLISSNIKFGTELLEACTISNVKWFINTGTFWQNFENEEYNPINLYAATKEAFQIISKYYTETSNLIFTTIKLNDTFGPNDTRHKVFNLWNKIAQSGETLSMSAGEQIIDISYIDDVLNAYEMLINHLESKSQNDFKNKVFAVKSDERMTLKELSKIFEEVTNKRLKINWGERAYRERESMIPWEDGEILSGWKPKYTLKEAIIKTLGEN